MRLVDQKKIIPLMVEKALEGNDRIEKIVVVADNQVAPEGNVQLKLERAEGAFF